MTSRSLLDVLQERFPDSSKTTLRKMLQNDRVSINGVTERDARRIITGSDHLDLGPRLDRGRLSSRVRILYEDESIITVHKDPGLLTVASPAETSETVESFLNLHLGGRSNDPRIHVVHRLDRDSSGVLVFARNTHVRDKLQELFAEHDIERVYVAIVHGALRDPTGTFRSFLTEDRSLRVKSDTKGGKEAITHFKTIAAGESYSMLEVTLETGRRNQIRVHLAESGHSIVGDTMYGQGLPNPLGRLGLHARDLGFVHPITRKLVAFTAPVPSSFTQLKL
ncbi:MAG TPA: RluA family pseudouridine synthase [Thermoanaerobaculia bacterium]|nr:RluA family pseudouridine synthase [Thermoanaerobaculia bacterium]